MGAIIHHHRFPKCRVIGATVTLCCSHPSPLFCQQHVTNEMRLLCATFHARNNMTGQDVCFSHRQDDELKK